MLLKEPINHIYAPTEDDLDIARMMDEGCPNEAADTRHVNLARRAGVGFNRLHRRHKNMIHGVILVAIAVAVIVDGPKMTDVLFLCLSGLCELS